MRLKSEIWVHAVLRRCQVQGLYGAVLRTGATEAGAVFVVINHLNGTYDLLGPAPGAAIDVLGERRFVLEFAQPSSLQEVEALLQRRRKSDPDVWEIEIEDRSGYAGLAIEKF